MSQKTLEFLLLQIINFKNNQDTSQWPPDCPRFSCHCVHFAVQHLYFSATWFQTWKSCIWCWKLSSHQTAYFKTQHLMPEVWKKYFSSSTCIPKAGEVFLNLTREHKSWTEDDSIVRVTYLTFQNVFGNDPWHFSHKTVSINIVCLKKGLNLQWQGYLLRKVKFNK